MHFRATVEGVPIEGRLTRSGERMEKIEALIEDRSYTLELVEVEPGVYWMLWNNRSIEITVTSGPNGAVVSIDGRRIPVEMEGAGPPRPRNTPKSAGRHDGAVELRAPMPGKVVRTLVSVGDAVRADQGVVVMEAMKMQNEIRTPKGGVVASLTVKEGALVNAGDVLATVE
ncbi:MAG TPA: biotin/lipoyl-containing protein [Terriglobia bacterium]|nr:biotin/lipoyl-containing protein [Terriglobia bacterium]